MLTRRAVGLIFLATLLTSVPYLLALDSMDAGAEFSGFLLNPIDGFSYLAKMRQGASGAFEFSLPYASEPGPGSALFAFHLSLGWLANATGSPPLLIYHLARAIGTILMFSATYVFFDQAFDSGAGSRWAFALALFGSGIGWLGIPFDLLAIDLWVPEAIPFLSAYANAHFSFASAAMLFAISLVAFKDVFPRLKAPLAFGCGFLLGVTQPFAVLSTGLVLLGWILLENRLQLAVLARDKRLHLTVAFIGGAAPIVLYDYLATQVSANLGIWAAQNSTPSPSLPATVLGYGVLIPFAIVALARRRTSWSSEFRLMLIWVTISFLLLYAPIPLQRRMALGLYFPLAGLAAIGIGSFGESKRIRRLLFALALALSVPSILIVLAAGVRSAANHDPALVLVTGERETYRWIERNAPERALFLTGPRTGNRIPAFTAARVLYGHPFETPMAQTNKQLVIELFTWEAAVSDAKDRLTSNGVDYVVYGPEERTLGSPNWLGEHPLVFEQEQFQIFQIIEG